MTGARVVPHQSATDLADQDVGDAELACELDGALVRLADVVDLVPVEHTAAAVELVRRFEQRGDVVRLEERPRGRRDLQVDVAFGGGVAKDVLGIAPTGVLEHHADGRDRLVDRPVRQRPPAALVGPPVGEHDRLHQRMAGGRGGAYRFAFGEHGLHEVLDHDLVDPVDAVRTEVVHAGRQSPQQVAVGLGADAAALALQPLGREHLEVRRLAGRGGGPVVVGRRPLAAGDHARDVLTLGLDTILRPALPGPAERDEHALASKGHAQRKARAAGRALADDGADRGPGHDGQPTSGRERRHRAPRSVRETGRGARRAGRRARAAGPAPAGAARNRRLAVSPDPERVRAARSRAAPAPVEDH